MGKKDFPVKIEAAEFFHSKVSELILCKTEMLAKYKIKIGRSTILVYIMDTSQVTINRKEYMISTVGTFQTYVRKGDQ